MTKYRVPVRLVIDGAVLVEAEDEIEAEHIVCYNIRGTLGIISDNECESVIDYIFNHHGNTEIRDNESIEELDEDEITLLTF